MNIEWENLLYLGIGYMIISLKLIFDFDDYFIDFYILY